MLNALSPTIRWYATRYGLFKAGVKRVGISYEAEWPQSHNGLSKT